MNKKIKRGALSWGFPVALFIFAGNMLTVGKGNFIELLLAGTVGALALPVSAVAADALFEKEHGKGLNKVIFAIFALVSAVAAIYVASLTVKDFSDFVGDVMLLKLPTWAVGIIFTALCSYLAARGCKTLKKFSFLAIVAVAISAIVLFTLAFESFEINRVYDVIRSARDISIDGVINTFSTVFAPAVIAVIYISATGRGEGRSKASLFGAIIALLLLALCFMNVFLLLGESFGGSEDYPYSTAVSTVTAGKLFARMEGFAYMMYYAGGAVRVSLCVALISLLSEKITGKKWRFLPYASGVGIFLVTIILSLS